MSQISFDEKRWEETIKKPDWYIDFFDYVKQNKRAFEDDSEWAGEFRYNVRHFFELALQNNKVALAHNGPNLDEERQPPDTIVIHHTSNKPSYRLSYLNAVHLLNIYVPNYANPKDERQKSLNDAGIWSGHFYKGQQVFWGYHWFMRMDGSFERLLQDDQIGWHAGNWDINKRSVGICLDNDYNDKNPSDEILQELADHIKKHYSGIEKIIGHCEARQGTTCPGTNFLDGWSKDLLSYLP